MTLRELDEVADGIDYEGILWDYLEAQPGGDDETCAAMQKFRRDFPTWKERRDQILSQFGGWPVKEARPGDGEIIVKLGKPGKPGGPQ